MIITYFKKIRIHGTSLGMTIPPDIKELLSLKADDMLKITIEKIKEKGVKK